MPTKVLPSSRAGGGPRKRRPNHHSSSQQYFGSSQTRRPRCSAVSSSCNRDPAQQLQIRMRNARDMRDDSFSQSDSGASGDRDSSSGSYINIGSIGTKTTRSQNSPQHGNQTAEDNISDVSSGSEAFFQQQYRSILTNKKERQAIRSPLVRQKRSFPPSQSEPKGSKSRSMQLCGAHQRQLWPRADHSSSQVAYQAAHSPLTTSDSSEDRVNERIEAEISASARRLARLAQANKNTSNRRPNLPQQRPPRRGIRYGSPVQPETPPQFSPSPVQESPDRQSPIQQHQSYPHRSSQKNQRNYYSDFECDSNASNRDEIYFAHAGGRHRYPRQSDQQVRQSAVHSQLKNQQQLQDLQKQQKIRQQLRQRDHQQAPGRQYAQLQRQQSRLSNRHSSLIQPEAPLQFSPSPVQQSPTPKRQLHPRRSDDQNQRDSYSAFEFDDNTSNRSEIYADDCRGRRSHRKSVVQPQPRHEQQLQQLQQQQKMRLKMRQQEQQQSHQRRMERIYVGNHDKSDLMGQRRRRQRPDPSELYFETNICAKDEGDQDTCLEEDDNINDDQQLLVNSERQNNRRSLLKREKACLDRRTSIPPPRHWCRDGSQLYATESRRQTLLQCPYAALSLHTHMYQCKSCAATPKQCRTVRNDSNRYQSGPTDESDDEDFAAWSKNRC